MERAETTVLHGLEGTEMLFGFGGGDAPAKVRQ